MKKRVSLSLIKIVKLLMSFRLSYVIKILSMLLVHPLSNHYTAVDKWEALFLQTFRIRFPRSEKLMNK